MYESSISNSVEQVPVDFSVPLPDENDIYTIEELKAAYPTWEEHYEGDAELTAMNVERRRYLKGVNKITGTQIYDSIGGIGLEWAMMNIPHEVGMLFDAHGIAGKRDAIEEIDALLSKGIDKSRGLWSMNFLDVGVAANAFGADHPFTKGGCILVADCGKKLLEDGIRYVVVGEEYNRVLPILRKRYPGFEIITWNVAPAIFAQRAMEITGKDFPVVELTKENAPQYADGHFVSKKRDTSAKDEVVPSSTDESEWVDFE